MSAMTPTALGEALFVEAATRDGVLTEYLAREVWQRIAGTDAAAEIEGRAARIIAALEVTP